jgi:hypothetical protein
MEIARPSPSIELFSDFSKKEKKRLEKKIKKRKTS